MSLGTMREKLLAAMESGIPFVIETSDGTRHKIAGRFRVALGQNIAMVIGQDELGHLVPLTKVTDISYSRRK